MPSLDARRPSSFTDKQTDGLVQLIGLALQMYVQERAWTHGTRWEASLLYFLNEFGVPSEAGLQSSRAVLDHDRPLPKVFLAFSDGMAWAATSRRPPRRISPH